MVVGSMASAESGSELSGFRFCGDSTESAVGFIVGCVTSPAAFVEPFSQGGCSSAVAVAMREEF